MNKFKVGDKVSTEHHAWSKTFSGPRLGKRIHRFNGQGELQKYQVVAVGCKIPVNMSATANTLVYNEDTGSLIVINDCNLTPYVVDITVQFVSGGVIVKLSEESKREVLRVQLRSHGV